VVTASGRLKWETQTIDGTTWTAQPTRAA
jgi:hypothetical protein